MQRRRTHFSLQKKMAGIIWIKRISLTRVYEYWGSNLTGGSPGLETWRWQKSENLNILWSLKHKNEKRRGEGRQENGDGWIVESSRSEGRRTTELEWPTEPSNGLVGFGNTRRHNQWEKVRGKTPKRGGGAYLNLKKSVLLFSWFLKQNHLNKIQQQQPSRSFRSRRKNVLSSVLAQKMDTHHKWARTSFSCLCQCVVCRPFWPKVNSPFWDM